MTGLLLSLMLILIGANQAVPGVASVTIAEENVVLRINESVTFSAEVEVSGGASTAVRWFSSDATVARVDPDGTVTGLMPGVAVITAVSEVSASRTDSVRVVVSDADATALSHLDARVERVGRLALSWTVRHADRVEVRCAGEAGATIETLAGDASETTIAIPPSSCVRLEVEARGELNTVTAQIEPRNVVRTGGDAAAGEAPIPGSLRAVLADAEDGDVIGFASDVREVVLTGTAVFGPHDAHLILERDVTVSASPDDPVTVRSDDSLPVDTRGIPVMRRRIVYVTPDAEVRLEGLVLRGGTFAASGGAIRNDGVLTIVGSTLEGNQAFYRGGAVHNLGTLVIEDSTLRGNSAIVTDAVLAIGSACVDDVTRACAEGGAMYVTFGTGGSGGALFNEGGVTRIVRSVVEGNAAVYSGGGIYVASGRVEAIDSEIRDNVASDDAVVYETYSFGGGIASFSEAGVFVTRGTIANNTSANVGGGIANGSNDTPDRPMTLRDVRIEGNRAGEYGGGLIHYYRADLASLQELGSTEVSGNLAGAAAGGDDGDDRYFSEVTGTAVPGPAYCAATALRPTLRPQQSTMNGAQLVELVLEHVEHDRTVDVEVIVDSFVIGQQPLVVRLADAPTERSGVEVATQRLRPLFGRIVIGCGVHDNVRADRLVAKHRIVAVEDHHIDVLETGPHEIGQHVQLPVPDRRIGRLYRQVHVASSSSLAASLRAEQPDRRDARVLGEHASQPRDVLVVHLSSIAERRPRPASGATTGASQNIDATSTASPRST